MKRIAYIELDTHAEIASDFMQMADRSEKLSADYYCSPKILQQLELQPVETVFESSADTILKQLAAKQYDLIVIGTVHRYFNTFEKIVSKYTTAVMVHNRNFAGTDSATLFRKIFAEDQLYRLKLLFREGLLSAPKVYRNAASLFVLDPSLADARFRFLPLFYTPKISFPNSEVLSVVIPGAVSQQRRDYKRVFEWLRKVKTPLKVTFLGKASDPELQQLKKLEQEVSESVSVRYFTEKVPKSLFSAVMGEADLLWCPVQEKTSFFSIPEYYGKTKMSGNIGDAVHYGKPAVFPEYYADLYKFVISEKDIWSILTGKKPLKRVDFSAYSIAAVQAKFENTLLSLV